jgi:DNA-binding CsgD family transcriptional regulator
MVARMAVMPFGNGRKSMRSHLGELDALVHSFYEAASVPGNWRAVLERTAQVFGADGTCILAFPSSAIGAVWTPSLDELADTFFAGGWHLKNERMIRGQPMRPFRPVVTESDLFTPDELDRHPFNAELMNRHGMRWNANCFLGAVDGWETGLGMERTAKRERFSAEETDALRSILPHMRTAAQVASRLALAKGQGMLEAFDNLGCAALLLGHNGRVTSHNTQAKPYIGRDITIVQGCLLATHKGSNDGLQRLVGGVLGNPMQPPAHRQTVATLTRRDGSGRPLFALGMPLVGAAQDVFQHAKAMVLLIDPDAQVSPPELILRHGFSLTPAELRLALAMIRGVTLADYAETNRVTIGTARIQLKAVMAKTGTHRQADLVALLARLSVVPPQEDV